MNDLAHAGLFLAQTVALAAALVYAARCRRAAREAVKAERAAWLHAGDAGRHAARAEAALPPDVIPFPADKVRGADPEAPAVLKVYEPDDEWPRMFRGTD